MINQKNYETYFMLYADNELSAAEREAVLLFVEDHPAYKQEFDLMNKIKLTPDNSISFSHKEEIYQGIEDEGLHNYRYEPDQNIVYGDKKELYRVEEKSIMVWFRPMAIAASLLLILGLVWLIRPSTEDKPIAKASSPNGKGNAIKENVKTESSFSLASEPVLHANLFKKTKQSNLVFTVRHEDEKIQSNIDIESQTESTPSLSHSIASADKNSEIFSAAPSDQYHIVPSSVNEIKSQPLSTEVADSYLISSESQSARKDRFRGIIRKINRFLGKDRVESDQVKYIQVANFQLAVAQ